MRNGARVPQPTCRQVHPGQLPHVCAQPLLLEISGRALAASGGLRFWRKHLLYVAIVAIDAAHSGRPPLA
jgi:hypothetical protein